MSLLVLGGGGFVGSAIVRRAVEVGLDVHAILRPSTDPVRLGPCRHDVTVHSADVADAARLGDIVARVRPTVVVMAAFPPHPEDNREYNARCDAARAVVDNTIATGEALRCVSGDARLVLIGSLMVYGRGGQTRHPRQPTRPQTYRGALKVVESTLAIQFAEETGTEFAELRVGSVYGPFPPMRRLFGELMRAALLGNRISLTPTPVARDLIHCDDVADACLAAIASSGSPLVVNVASGMLTSIHELAAVTERVVGRPLIADMRADIPDRYGDVEPAMLPSPDELDWQPAVRLADGIGSCWAWAQSPAGRRYMLEGQH